VSFGGTPATSFTVISDTVVDATVGLGASGFVAVANAAGSDSLAGFTFIPVAAPTHINYFNPTSGTTGTTVFIHGVSFTGTTFVGFGGVSASSFTVTGDTLISAVVGGGASGAVAVSGPRGSDSLAGFTYTPPVSDTPHILSFAPDSGTTGTIVTINGMHFTGVSVVSFGGTPASSFTVISDSVLDATVGNGSSGFVAMANAAGSDSLAGFVFVDSTGSTDSTDSTPSTHAWLLKEYPNPAMGMLYVTAPNTTASAKLILADMNGKAVRIIYLAPNATNVRLNISGLVNGVYKLVWSDGKHLVNQTVLVLNE
jgi:hypothetical protein